MYVLLLKSTETVYALLYLRALLFLSDFKKRLFQIYLVEKVVKFLNKLNLFSGKSC